MDKMVIQSLIDWKGNPISKEKHGGQKAAKFIYFMAAMSNMAFVSNVLNLVTYLHDNMHMDVASSSTTVTNLIGVTCAFSLFGGFLSDSYITRFKVILLFGPFEFLGFGLLALQAHLPSLQPPKCNTTLQWSDCKQVHGYNAALLYIAMYVTALGEGCLRANIPSFGGDQFDEDDTAETQLKSSFFNWLTLGISLGSFTGLIFIVWIENNRGWDIGFAVSAGVIVLGLLAVACGFSFYRHQTPRGSPLTRILQVLVAAFRNRKFHLPENEAEQNQEEGKEESSEEMLQHTKGFKFLDKASVFHGNAGKWYLCSVTQVEETKIVLRMLPIFLSAVIGYLPNPQLLTFTVQQGRTMDTKVGKIQVSPATLLIIPIALQIVLIVVYDRFFVPFARKITGIQTGITHLQRIGVGFLATSLATCVGAIIEIKRKSIAKEHGILDSGEQVPMSVMWLGLQFVCLSIVDVFTFVGLLEFFNSEAWKGMKSLGTAFFWCILGISSLLGSSLVNIVNDATKHAGSVGWLEGNNLNRNFLDRFYWLLSILGLLGFFNYLYWARRYTYRYTVLLEIGERNKVERQLEGERVGDRALEAIILRDVF